MFNLVAINLPDREGNYERHCQMPKCRNEGRYQLYNDIEDSGLPDWEGKTICSRHLMEESRHRPEIVMSLIDILIDTMEQHALFPEEPIPQGPGGPHILPFRRAKCRSESKVET
jgi:hypothetical protein